MQGRRFTDMRVEPHGSSGSLTSGKGTCYLVFFDGSSGMPVTILMSPDADLEILPNWKVTTAGVFVLFGHFMRG